MCLASSRATASLVVPYVTSIMSTQTGHADRRDSEKNFLSNSKFIQHRANANFGFCTGACRVPGGLKTQLESGVPRRRRFSLPHSRTLRKSVFLIVRSEADLTSS